MEEIDLKELFQTFWNKKIHILLITLIFIVIGIIYTIGFVTPMYTSSTTLVLAGADKTTDTNKQGSTITTTDVTLNSKLVETYSVILQTKDVLREVIKNLGINISEEEIKNNITVSAVKNTEVIQISVNNENATNAAKITNEIAKVFSKKVGEIYNINNVYVLDEAEVSTNPSNINHTKDIVVFAFIGLVISVMYVLIANMLDTTVKTQEDIEKAIKIPVLATIPIYNLEMEKLKKKGGRR
ncbi:MAG: YveK family protein [Clostridia bacterium]